jgi:hypothetical protein
VNILPKRVEITRGWRKLYNEELRNLLSSSDIIIMIKSRRVWWTGHVTCVGKKGNMVLVGKPEGKRPRRPKSRWKYTIKMDIRKVWWIVSYHQLVLANLLIPQNIWKFLSSLATNGFSRRIELHEVSWLVGWLVGWGKEAIVTYFFRCSWRWLWRLYSRMWRRIVLYKLMTFRKNIMPLSWGSKVCKLVDGDTVFL